MTLAAVGARSNTARAMGRGRVLIDIAGLVRSLALGMLLMAWASGVAVGMVLLPIKPWWPEAAALLNTIWSRANMIASGKMFVANTLSFTMLSVFDWNPLFHLIDQARGYCFINYYPRYTSIQYPAYVSLALLMIGLMGEYYTRKNASISWSARR